MRSERMLPPVGDRQFFHHVERCVGFEPGDDPATDGVEFSPPGIIVIAEIEDIGGTRLDRHLLGHGDVVDVGRGDCGIDRAIGIGIVNHVHFGTADPGREPRPAGAALVQARARGIDQVGRLGKLATQPAMGLLHHHRQQVGEHCDRSLCVRIREGRSPNRIRAHMVEPHRMARKSCHDLAQARRTRKLAVEQRHQLALGRKSAHPRIGTMVFHKAFEPMPRNVLQKSMKYAILMPHGLILLRVPKRRQTLGTQKNQRHAPCPQKSNRTAVGQARHDERRNEAECAL